MHNRVLFGLLTVFLASSTAVAADDPLAPETTSTTMSPTMQRAIDEVANEFVASGRVPGMVIGVSERGRITFVRGYGLADVEHRVPARADTVFGTGSMGKQFTAAAILLLAERGKLSLDDPLSKYVPDFPRAQDVKIRQLMSHTAGVVDYVREGFIGGNDSRIERTPDELIRFITDVKELYEFSPGTDWSYSNSNFILLGKVIEKASGGSYADFLKQNFFAPLGLDSTALDEPSEIVPNRATGYRRGKESGTFKNAEFLAMSNFWSAGGLRSTAVDLLRWEDALLDGKVLAPASVSLMMTPARLKDGRIPDKWADGRKAPFLYGLGAIASEPVAGHRAMGNGGFMPGFNTWVRRLPDDDITVVVLVNMTGQARDVAAKLVPVLLERRSRSSQT